MKVSEIWKKKNRKKWRGDEESAWKKNKEKNSWMKDLVKEFNYLRVSEYGRSIMSRTNELTLEKEWNYEIEESTQEMNTKIKCNNDPTENGEHKEDK